VSFQQVNYADVFDRIVRDRTPEEEATAAVAGLPELLIDESDPTATAKLLAKLIAGGTTFLFNGHGLVRVVVEADGMPRAIEVNTEMIRVLAHEICRPVKLTKVKKDDGKIVWEKRDVRLSTDVALLYLNGLEGRWDVNHFRGISTAPILANDGSIRIHDGFDECTGLWCHNIPKLAVSPNPTEDTARRALSELRAFFQTFPFADSKRVLKAGADVETVDLGSDPGLDESAFLVALLTAVCRPSLPTAPGCLINSTSLNGAGTGKGLLVRSIAVIGSGAKPVAFTSGHNRDEFDKRLVAAMIKAKPVVFLDNFNSEELTSNTLASALTEDPCEVRLMGQSQNVPLYTRTLIAITGNGVTIAEDLARRLLLIMLDAKMEDPELRKFEPGSLDTVFEARGDLLTHALTIWRWGRQHEALPRGKPLGSFELWAQWCRDPLLALGCRDPIDRLAEIKAADPKRRALTDIFDAWWSCHQDDTLKASDIDDGIVQLIDAKALRSDGKVSRQKLARFLTQHADTRVGGYHLEQIKDTARTRPVAYYKLGFTGSTTTE